MYMKYYINIFLKIILTDAEKLYKRNIFLKCTQYFEFKFCLLLFSPIILPTPPQILVDKEAEAQKGKRSEWPSGLVDKAEKKALFQGLPGSRALTTVQDSLSTPTLRFPDCPLTLVAELENL